MDSRLLMTARARLKLAELVERNAKDSLAEWLIFGIISNAKGLADFHKSYNIK
jgi:hypothetical protein